MSGVANKDVLYSLVFVGCYGTWMFLARAVDFGAAGPGAGNDVYTRTVLTSATLLLAAFWAVLACSAYVVYDQACRSLAHRFRSREKQDEMIKLMHAIDDSTLTPASVYAAHPYVADQQEEKPATVNLRHRNDLLVTMYVVGVALYFTMIGLGQLDPICSLAFTVGLWALAAQHAFLRARCTPTCVVPTQVASIHKHAVLVEGWVLLTACMCLGFLVYECVHTNVLYVPAHMLSRVFMVWTSFTAPFMVARAPRHQHYMTTYELAMPVAALMALSAAFFFMDSAGLATLVVAFPGFDRYIVTVSLLFGVTFLAVLHALYSGYAISLTVATIFFLLVRTIVDHHRDESWLLVAFAGMLLVLVLTSFAYLVYYRHRHILTQVTHLRHNSMTNVQAAHHATAAIVCPPLPPTPPAQS